ncbi:hypothetical protein LMG28614_04782 [Paraburkholderia ultramafica]|uniref:Uncharacterized protein n=1 Tax=Paraburkholderia ultramafica TaxID=1544867 RepID=A0A6S7BFS1_9BURK|nr:hypothetical protein [Paraburkholderia ultramafica]CAB3798535.1 hypothetical protein LMG28614_04782 [Paraburkholderia ultramafica]
MRRVKSERDRLMGVVLQSVDGIPAEHKLTGYARFIDDGLLQVGAHTRVRARGIVLAHDLHCAVLHAFEPAKYDPDEILR